MSMSTQHGGGTRRPSAGKPAAGGKPNLAKDTAEATETDGAKPAPAKSSAKSSAAPKSAAAKSAAAAKSGRPAAGGRSGAGARAAAGGRPAGGGRAATGARPAGKAGGRKPITPVKVSQGRNWTPIVLFAVVIMVALGIVGFGAWKVYESGLSLEDRVERISGAVNFRKDNPEVMKVGLHEWGPLQYPQSPPVAGKHNPNWMNCMGNVYDAPIASEHAVHSMEHGAVWVTYNPDRLTPQQVEQLAAKVRGKDYLLMSPYTGLDKAVSVQAWGFQLKVDDPADKRIDKFISVTRKNAAIEPGASCSEGITKTGTTPSDLGKNQPQQGG